MDVVSMAKEIGCCHESLPFTYLGLPVGKNMNRCDGWTEVINRFTNRLSSWKAKHLSFGGRITLTKAVLGSLPLYFFSIFKAPMTVIEKLESIRRRFFWNFSDGENGIYWISWKKLMTDKECGGLGLGSLRAKNLGLIGKWAWRFHTDMHALWRKVIFSIYGPTGNLSNASPRCTGSSVWARIIAGCRFIDKSGVSHLNSIRRKVADGRGTRFWLDKWGQSDSILKDKFPRLFNLDQFPNCYISERRVWSNGSWTNNWDWRSQPRGRSLGELAQLEDTLNQLVLDSSKKDGWNWDLDASGCFSVSKLTLLVQRLLFSSHTLGEAQFRWNSWVPLKVNFCVWRVFLNRLPTRINLLYKGVPVESIRCAFCDQEWDSLEHSLVTCSMVRGLWRKIYTWWNLDGSRIRNLAEIIQGNQVSLNNKQKIKCFQGVSYVALWSIWNWRNRVNLASTQEELKKAKDEDIFPRIQRFSLLWLHNRSRYKGVNWDAWVLHPLNVIPD